MAFPVSQPNVIYTFQSFQSSASVVQSTCTAISQATTNIPAQQVMNLLTQCNNLNNMVTTLNANQALVTSMLAFLPTLFPTLTGQTPTEMQTSFDAAVTALQALITAITADLPADSSGFLQTQTLQSGVPTMTSFTTAQLPKTLPAITAFLATVD